MSKLGTILGLLSLGRSFTDTALYRRFLSGVAAVICLTIVTSMLAGALLLALFYGVYELFLAYGLTDGPAIIATCALAALTLAILVMTTISHLRGLTELPSLLMQYNNPIASRASGIAQAFMDGFNTTAPAVRPRNVRWSTSRSA